MTLTEARELVGTDRLWLAPVTGKLLVGVRITDARVSYGRTQVQIQPLSGRGYRWVDPDFTQEIED
ncbi:hypothetical protein BBK14_33705 [Parafrankia soli]|uniref:Uncharacterized protein n=1 Tax=Parafrankia soli TaxID=2599596 RepID=A0A1S1QLL4_9ACTN|nr:hypothetical protein [Parafrankia soli]OHV29815.1 hypothetical protein BBK14_34095 [Parafrankia soli]OHV33194.1 hypothetical protein BBK14_33705 [Parafrankia soli]